MAIKKTVKKLGAKEKREFHLEIEVNDKVFKFDTNDLHKALVDFSNSEEFPYPFKTGLVFKYSKGKVTREKLFFNTSEARREFENKVALELLAKSMVKELA